MDAGTSAPEQLAKLLPECIYSNNTDALFNTILAVFSETDWMTTPVFSSSSVQDSMPVDTEWSAVEIPSLINEESKDISPSNKLPLDASQLLPSSGT